MKQSRPIMHAKDHLPGGADPIPGLAALPPPGDPGAPVDPVDHEIPKHAPPEDKPWHWWRFQTVERQTPDDPEDQTLKTPDVVTNLAANQMSLYWDGAIVFGGSGAAGTVEVVQSGSGPNADSVSILRLQTTLDTGPPFHLPINPDNYYRGAFPLTATDPDDWGAGGTWTLLGWFNFAALANWDIFNFSPSGSGHPNPTYLLLNADGSVSLTRWGSTWTSAAGLVSAGVWAYIGITLANGRLRVYVNPGPPEATDYAPAYGADFPFDVPMVMETWGLAKDYSASSLAAKATTNGFKSVAVRLNPPPEDLPPGMTHAEYITQLTSDVATLQAAGLQVVGWGVADSTTGADLTASGVNGWMPQIEGPGQYDSCMAALAAGVGAGLPKAVVSNFGGLEDPADVAALAAAGIDAVAVEAYAEVPGHENLTGMLWQATQQGFSAPKVIAMLGTYRGETPDDYTGLDEDVIPSYGIYNAPQTSETAWSEFGQLNQGQLMLSRPVIDVADPATGAQSGVLSIGAPNAPINAFGTDGSYEGYASEIVLYWSSVPSSGHRSLSLSGSYGDTGTVPVEDQIPAGAITPNQISPGADGQHLVTDAGMVKWEADTGGGASTLDDLTDVSTSGAADNDVLTYDSGTSGWAPSAGTPGPTGATGPPGATGPAGPTGPTGPTGAAGQDGERWFSGTGAPAGGLAGSVVGDWYLDSASGDFYEKTGSSAWTVRGNLMGPAGSSGSPGQADVQTFTSSGTWTKPAGVKVVKTICVGAGGGGGGGAGGQGASARSGGGGGGGGALFEDTFRATDLSGTVAVTVGTGGAGGTAGGASPGAGGNGGTSSFGAYTQACGGGGGPGGTTGNTSGGGGGGYLTGGSGITGGTPRATSSNGLVFQAGIPTAASAGGVTEFGGAAGGGGTTGGASGAGGSSTRGGPGGAAGGGLTATPNASPSNVGGASGSYTAGGGGTAGTSGASPTAGGAGGSVSGRYCGNGGGGGGATAAASLAGGNGGAGGAGAGGGGGGSASSGSGGTGGQGGDGLVVVISW